MGEISSNPLVDTSNTTVAAFKTLKDKMNKDQNLVFGRDDTLENTPVNKVKVKAWTQTDKKTHTYFHSLSIDKQVEDFMGTAELRCRYDSDLMGYWEPIRQTVVIYGTNRGEYKILFIGRVREVRQEGYEMCIVFQDYGWKFKQLVSQSYANDNVLNKDGYTIMKIMFAALKIDSWVISPAAKTRLKQVGIDKDGNLVANKKKVEEIPDLIKRLKKSDPQKAINKYTVLNKVKESQVHNLKNINYTLKYEKKTPVMKKLASNGGDFSAGKSVYSNTYSSPGSSSNTGGGAGGGNGGSTGNSSAPNWVCDNISDSSLNAAMQTIWAYNRGLTNDYSGALSTIENYANNHPATYSSSVSTCLSTLQKYSNRGDGTNAASMIMGSANQVATRSGISQSVSEGISWASEAVGGLINRGMNLVGQVAEAAGNLVGGLRSFLHI